MTASRKRNNPQRHRGHRGRHTEKTKYKFITVMPRNKGFGFLGVVFLCDLRVSVVG
jgi:hypothetical protein